MPKDMGYIYHYDKTQKKIVFEHRTVAEQKIGRSLTKNDIVHHLDGDKENNNPDNLVVITRAEHSKIHHPRTKLVAKRCLECGIEFVPKNSSQKYCSSYCAHKSQERCKIPSKEELCELVWKYPTTHIASHYGVSDNAVANWCEKYSISKPPRGYWSKIKKSGITK